MSKNNPLNLSFSDLVLLVLQPRSENVEMVRNLTDVNDEPRIKNNKIIGLRETRGRVLKNRRRSANFSCLENARRVLTIVCFLTTRNLRRSWSFASSTFSNVAPRRRNVFTFIRASPANTTTPDIDVLTRLKPASSVTSR